jgi:geranylgeranyl diphosphate synthase type I
MEKRPSPEDRFRRFSRSYAGKIDAAIRGFFDGKIRRAEYPFIGEMYGLLREYCGRDGKRVRPLVMIASCAGYGGRIPPGRLARIASVLELMHSFLLVQDDIIDRSDLRRGGKSLHRVCRDRYGKSSHNEMIGNDIALILGDVLIANALEVLGNAGVDSRRTGAFLEEFARSLELTAWGQILDIMNSRSKKQPSPRETALRIGMMKTAHYTVHYPMLLGCILAGADSRGERKRIRDFALPLGVAFQVRDDILGVFGREERTGKPSDSDILEGKMTLLVSGAMELLRGSEKRRFMALFSGTNKSARDVEEIRGMIAGSGSLAMAKQLHGERVRRSSRALERLSINEPMRGVLEGLVSIVAAL